MVGKNGILDDLAKDFLFGILCPKGGKLDDFVYLFDFRSPSIKRAEFKKLYKKNFELIFYRDKGVCQLNIQGICDSSKGWNIDHLIPLSSNKLNILRGVKPKSGKKVITESFGSNDLRNLVLACKPCNAKKKHRFWFNGEFY